MALMLVALHTKKSMTSSQYNRTDYMLNIAH